MSLNQVLKHSLVWRGRDHDFHQSRGVVEKGCPSGFAALDGELPGGGWPAGALTEILHDQPGQGELQLLLPTLTRLTGARRHVALIDPPWLPYAPALVSAGIDLRYLLSIGPLNPADRLWALEQTLRAGHCAAVLAWPLPSLDTKVLRRLQLAAEAGGSYGFLYRNSSLRQQHSPAALRLQLLPAMQRELRVEVVKCRGRYFSRPLLLRQASA